MIISRRLDVTSHASFDAHEQVVHFEDAALGLQAIIAVHNTHLPPSTCFNNECPAFKQRAPRCVMDAFDYLR